MKHSMRSALNAGGSLGGVGIAVAIVLGSLQACGGATSSDLLYCVDAACTDGGTSPVGADGASPVGTDGASGTAPDGSAKGPGTDAGGTQPVADSGPVDPTPCMNDTQCPNGLCNWKLQKCAAPAPDGSACQRDEECADGLCNWKLQKCAAPAANGSACQRDEECTSALCNWKTETCSTPGPAGAPCQRDQECASNTCKMQAGRCN